MSGTRRLQISLRGWLLVTGLLGPLCYLISYYYMTQPVPPTQPDADWIRLKRVAARQDDMAQPVRLGQVVLLRKGTAVAAFVAVHQAAGSVQYRWWYRTDGKGRLDENDINVRAGTDTVTRDEDVAFGPLKFRCSRAKEEWVWVGYDSSDKATPNRFCFTDLNSIRGLDALDSRWRYKVSAADDGLTANNEKD